MVTHKEAMEDYDFLYELVEVDDTIAFAADEVFDLMADPTKVRARRMYECGISQWFKERLYSDNFYPVCAGHMPRVLEISRKYGEEYYIRLIEDQQSPE